MLENDCVQHPESTQYLFRVSTQYPAALCYRKAQKDELILIPLPYSDFFHRCGACPRVCGMHDSFCAACGESMVEALDGIDELGGDWRNTVYYDLHARNRKSTRAASCAVSLLCLVALRRTGGCTSQRHNEYLLICPVGNICVFDLAARLVMAQKDTPCDFAWLCDQHWGRMRAVFSAMRRNGNR